MTSIRFDRLNETPFWTEGMERSTEPGAALPAHADVVIIGSGYTGLNAAIEVARAGRSVAVLETGTPGMGCSTRNGGQIGPGIKPTPTQLARKYGAARGQAIWAEGPAAMDWIEARITSEKIACDYSRCGLYFAAHTPQHYDDLAAWVATEQAEGRHEAYTVPKAEQRSELGSDVYFGGVVFSDHAGLHPAKYLQGLLRLARTAGAQVIGHCEARTIQRKVDGFLVETAQGRIRAGDVIVATNGYTGTLTPWLRRRVIPIASNIIATEELPQDLVRELFPTNRVVCDTRKVVYYYRASPDQRRVVFGGRVAARDIGAQETARRLHDKMCQIFPQLQDHGVTHSWSGNVAYTFDELPHIGCHDGVHYAMGYCGSGVAMSSYLGAKIGQQVLGLPEGTTAFDGLSHPTRPLYTGKPWFLPAAVAWYKWRDTRAQSRARAG